MEDYLEVEGQNLKVLSLSPILVIKFDVLPEISEVEGQGASMRAIITFVISPLNFLPGRVV